MTINLLNLKCQSMKKDALAQKGVVSASTSRG